MQTYELLVKERSVRPNSRDMTLVRTSIGIDQVHVLFDNAEWLDFPITVTFAQGEDVITIPIIVGSVSNSEWVAEATVTIPHEVIDMTGAIRVTFQGTDSSGRHIITAKGSPLSVEEAGDVIEGLAPSDAPTVSDWQQAYANGQVVINQAQSIVNDLSDQIDAIAAEAEERISHYDGYVLPVATSGVLGGVKIGTGVNVAPDGTISVPQSESSQVSINYRRLERAADVVELAFETDYDDDELTGAKVASSSIPPATESSIGGVIADGTSITVDEDGMIHAEAAYIPIATASRTGSVKPDGTTTTVDADGTLHSTIGATPATTEALGSVTPDGETIAVDAEGTISVIPLTEEEIVELTPTGEPIPNGDEMSW